MNPRLINIDLQTILPFLRSSRLSFLNDQMFVWSVIGQLRFIDSLYFEVFILYEALYLRSVLNHPFLRSLRPDIGVNRAN